jgi:hypothetical protein
MSRLQRKEEKYRNKYREQDIKIGKVEIEIKNHRDETKKKNT